MNIKTNTFSPFQDNSFDELLIDFSIQQKEKKIPYKKISKKDWFSEIDECSINFQECFNETDSDLSSLKTDMWFDEYIKISKNSRINHLGELLYSSKSSLIKIMEFFQKKEINLDTCREFLRVKSQLNTKITDRIIEWLFTNLSLEKNKEQILNEVLKKWPFETPKGLAFAISEYIKENMTYDWITLLNQITKELNNITKVEKIQIIKKTGGKKGDYNSSIEWKITEQYLDITDFILWRKLFRKHSEVLGKEWEFWVKNKNIQSITLSS